jgi:hypothetical protein
MQTEISRGAVDSDQDNDHRDEPQKEYAPATLYYYSDDFRLEGWKKGGEPDG